MDEWAAGKVTRDMVLSAPRRDGRFGQSQPFLPRAETRDATVRPRDWDAGQRRNRATEASVLSVVYSRTRTLCAAQFRQKGVVRPSYKLSLITNTQDTESHLLRDFGQATCRAAFRKPQVLPGNRLDRRSPWC